MCARVRVCNVCASVRYKGPKSIYLLRIETSHDIVNMFGIFFFGGGGGGGGGTEGGLYSVCAQGTAAS